MTHELDFQSKTIYKLENLVFSTKLIRTKRMLSMWIY